MGKNLTKEIGERVAKAAASRLAPYSIPWAVGATVPLGAGFVDWLWADQPLQGALTALGAAGLTALTWHAGRARRFDTRLHYAVNAGLLGAYTTAATAYGALDPTLVKLGAGVLLATSLAANVRRMVRGEGNDTHTNGGNDLLDALGLAARWRGRPKVEGGTVTVAGEIDRGAKGGQTVSDVQEKARAMEVKLGTPPGGVQITPDPADAGAFTAEMVPVDWLADWTAWPGPSAWGHSISSPVQIGPYRSGTPAQLWFPGDPRTRRNATSYGYFGMTGAGKTELFVVTAVEVLTRTDVVLWVADPEKRGQSLGPIASGVDWLTLDRESSMAMVKSLPGVINARMGWLGERGLKQWEPGCGIPYLVVHLEEFSTWLAENETIADQIKLCRSAGVSLNISLQRPTYTNLPTDVRQQLGGQIAMGLEKGDARYALPDIALESGADPERWGNRNPGYAYVCGPGIPEPLFATPLRCYQTDPGELAEAVISAAPIRAELDPVTRGAAGELYRAGHVNQIGGTVVVTATRADQEAPVTSHDDVMDDDLDQVPPNPEPGFLDDIDPEEPVEPPEVTIPLGGDAEPGAEVVQIQARTREEAQAALADHLAGLADSGVEEVSPRDLLNFSRTVLVPKRDRSWLSKTLTGWVAEDDGVLPNGVQLSPTEKAGCYRLRLLAGVSGQ